MFAVTLAILSYIDRVCISQAAPVISRELGLNQAADGLIFSAFALAYALFEIPGGWHGRLDGSAQGADAHRACGGRLHGRDRWMLNFRLAVSSASCSARARPAAFPNLTKAFTTWLPHDERVRRARHHVDCSRDGAAHSRLRWWSLLFHYVTWRGRSCSLASLGVVWAIFFYRWYRDNPRDHKSVNAAELALLRRQREQLASATATCPGAKLVAPERSGCFGRNISACPIRWYFYITWLPTYLTGKYRKLTDMQRARCYAILPLFFGGIRRAVLRFHLRRRRAPDRQRDDGAAG